MRLLKTVILLAGVAAYGSVDVESREARVHGAEAKYVYQVVDDQNQPVPGAFAHVSFTSYGRVAGNADWGVVSNSNGMFEVSHRVNERFRVGISKKGFYRSFDSIFYFGMSFPLPVKDGKWQPYGEVRRITLNRIRRPAYMRCFKRDYYKYPEVNHWHGFDLERADWTGNLGAGVHDDVLIRFSEEERASGSRRLMEVAFTNNVHGGLYVEPLNKHSEMRSSYCVDTNKVFSNMVVFTSDPNGSISGRHVLGGDDYLVFRTRTRVNAKGELVSAYYGKIYGPWEFIERGGMSIGRIVFNPVENDTNLEDEQTVTLSRSVEKR